MQQAIAYYRVSTQEQRRSGLGMEAQREFVERFAASNGIDLTAHYEEWQTGKGDGMDRPVLDATMKAAKKAKCPIIVAKLGRDAVKIPMMLHVFAVFAENEREQISQRTKLALAALKARGVKLGNPNPGPSSARARVVVSANAAAHAANVLPIIRDIQTQGHATYTAIANELNRRGVATKRGAVSTWHASTVRRLLARSG